MAEPASSGSVRLLVADTEHMFRAGISKLFAGEPDLTVVGLAATLGEALKIVTERAVDVLLLDTRLTLTPAATVAEVLKYAPQLKIVSVTPLATEAETIELLRRGVSGIVTREIDPELLLRCVCKVRGGEIWLDNQGVNWLIRAYTEQATQAEEQPRIRLNDKEQMIVAGVVRGMKNKDIATEVGTTEQVVKNYLRKIYDKLGIADRLELALYCVENRLLENIPTPKPRAMAAAAGVGMSVRVYSEEN